MPNNGDISDELKLLDQERIAAFARRDAKEFARLCDELGCPPEDEDLYQRGMAEIMEENKAARADITNYMDQGHLYSEELRIWVSMDKLDVKERYRLFLQETKDMCNALKIDLELKKTLIKRYFSQFRPGGDHDLERESMKKPGNIGFIFDKLVASAEKTTKKQINEAPQPTRSTNEAIDSLGVDRRYLLFLEKAKERKSSTYDEEIGQKKDLIMTHFPSFRAGKINDVNRMSDRNVRRKFKKLVSKAKEVRKEMITLAKRAKQAGG
jgi:hypothetical protein